jgi:hypothetical protein
MSATLRSIVRVALCDLYLKVEGRELPDGNIIETLESSEISITISLNRRQLVPLRLTDTEFSEMEKTIIEAINSDTLTGEQVAAKSGYPYDGSLKAALASLRRRGVLGNAHPGYFVRR